MIKLDIINEVVNKTGITKTKAELAVETVFDSMKKALSKGDRIELRGFGVFNVRRAKLSASSRARNCSRSTEFRAFARSCVPSELNQLVCAGSQARVCSRLIN